MTDQIVICSGYDFSERSIQRLKALNGKAIFVAISPYCCELLAALGIRYKSANDFIKESELNEIGRENYRVLDGFLNTIDNLSKQESAKIGLKIFPHRICYQCFYHFKRLLDCLIIAEELASRIVLNHPFCKKALVFGPEGKFAFTSSEFFEVHYVQMLSERLKFHNIKTIVNNTVESIARKSRLNPYLRRNIKSIIRYMYTLSEFLSCVWAIKRKLVEPIMFMHKDYDLKPIWESQSQSKGVKAVLWNRDIEKYIPLFLLKIVILPDYLKEMKAYKNVFLRTVSQLKIDTKKGPRHSNERLAHAFFKKQALEYFRSNLYGLLTWYFLGYVLAKSGLKKAFFSAMIANERAAFAHGMEKGGAVTYLFQHGGNFGWTETPIVEYIYSRNKGVICYDYNSAKYLKSRRPDLSTFVIGSTRLEKIRKRILASNPILIDRKRKMVLFAPNEPCNASQYFPHHAFSSITFWNNAKSIVNTLSQIPSIHILLKLSGIYKQKVPFQFIRLNPDIVSIEARSLVSDYLEKADIFVINWLATVILECALTYKPIIVFDLGLNLDRQVYDMLSKRVYWAHNQDELRKRVSYIINHYEEAIKEKDNDDFLYNYGLLRENSVGKFITTFARPRSKARK